MASAESPAVIKAVGTWGSLPNYASHEGPFWNETIAEASGGSIIGDIKPQTELGLGGFEIMRLVKNGVFDFAFGLPGYVAAENAVFEGSDLSSIIQDFDTSRAVQEAYFPIMEKAFAEIYNAKLMMLYPFPSQILYCNAEIGGIEDLEGKKIRVYSTTLGDFVEAVGGVSVTVPFAEVVPALEKGVVDCGITGTTSAYNAKWYQVASHAYTLRVGFGIAFGAMNMDKWNSMSSAQQETLTAEIAKLNDALWADNASQDGTAVSCLTSSDCPTEPGGMTLVEPSAEDIATRDRLATEVVLSRWAERCGAECAANWNDTVGKILGLSASAE
ncbi:MAG: TRAP transporter substrate-binding protein [Roseovarius sp.]|nr:TRAP transporter substrate-binding protein [Roseovarius sp.]MCY4292061.1 TRAP transporter substrate-binding protein [Roseovarius sp.]